jgi:Tfp pilus assembly protein PilW
MNSRQRGQYGFTVIEMLLALIISFLVITMLLGFYKEGLLSYDRTMNESVLQLDLRHAVEVISRDIRTSKAGRFAETEYPALNGTNELILFFTETEDEPVFIKYKYKNQQLIRHISSSDEEPLLDRVVDCQISAENSLVKMILTVVVPSGHFQQQISKEVIIQAVPRGKIQSS